MSYISKPRIITSIEQASAFGVPETAERTPVLQLDFPYAQLLDQRDREIELNSATVDINNGRIRTQSGTNSAGKAIYISKFPAKYRAGQGMVALFTPIFQTGGVASSIQAIGVFNLTSGNAINNGYGFGYNGTSFGIVRAVDGTLTWTAQSSWNVDKVDGTAGTAFNWDKGSGTPVMIKYPYLGYGDIFFFVQNPTTGEWIHVHTIQYANTSVALQIRNPSLHFVMYNENTGATTNKVQLCGSVGIFISGLRSYISSPKGTLRNTKAGITTATNLLTLRNATTLNLQQNESVVRLKSISFASSGTAGTATLRIIMNATLGGTPSFSAYNGTTADGGVTITSGQSGVSSDTAGTTVTGGYAVFSVTVDNPATSGVISLEDENIFIAPSDTLTLEGSASNASELSVTVNFVEDI